MSHRKPLERRTFLQDRYDILIKRQKSGKATFNELTELDDIVNRDPSIRERVLIENLFMRDADDFNGPYNDPEKEIQIKQPPHQSFLERLRTLIGRIFTSQVSVIKDHPFYSARINLVL